jgi:hypothetical protein
MSGSYRTGEVSASNEASAAVAYLTQSRVAAHTRRRLNPILRVETELAKQSLNQIAELEANWDGYGASPVSKMVRMNAWEALRRFEAGGAIPEITPLPNGTIAFDWYSNGVRGHFEIGRSKYSMYFTAADGTTRYYSGSAGNVDDEARDAISRALADSTGDESSYSESMTSIRFASTSVR